MNWNNKTDLLYIQENKYLFRFLWIILLVGSIYLDFYFISSVGYIWIIKNAAFKLLISILGIMAFFSTILTTYSGVYIWKIDRIVEINLRRNKNVRRKKR